MKKKQLIKSKYEISNLIHEDIISFCYSGTTHYINIPIIIWKYKSEYLNSNIVTKLINICEKLVHFNHKNTLSMIDYFYDGESFYTIHEGKDSFVNLDTYIKKEAKVNLKQLWNFSRQLLNVLLQLEQDHLFAGTINFSDVIVSSNNEIKIARLMIPIIIYKNWWKQIEVIEDCIFLAPEFFSTNYYSIRCDMYSFGVLMYVFFSQKWPYKYSIKIDQMKKEIIQGSKTFEPVSDKIPSKLTQVLSVCLSPDPENRFRTFLELIKVYKGDLDFSKSNKKSTSNVIQSLKVYIHKKKIGSLITVLNYVAVALFFVLLGVGMHKSYLFYITAIPEVVVPNVSGLTQFEAEDMLDDYNLEYLISGQRFHPNVKKGFVIESKPPSGRVVKEKRVVRLFVSKGKGPILVPDLIGYTRPYVEEKLVQRGLSTEVVKQEYSLQYDTGIVIGQDPMSNTFIGPSENIKLTISKGYPVQISTSKAKSSLFMNKDHIRNVSITFYMLDEWLSQELAIYYTRNEIREKIYSDLIDPGQDVKLDFELSKGGLLEILFNDEIIIKQVIEDSNS